MTGCLEVEMLRQSSRIDDSEQIKIKAETFLSLPLIMDSYDAVIYFERTSKKPAATLSIIWEVSINDKIIT